MQYNQNHDSKGSTEMGAGENSTAAPIILAPHSSPLFRLLQKTVRSKSHDWIEFRRCRQIPRCDHGTIQRQSACDSSDDGFMRLPMKISQFDEFPQGLVCRIKPAFVDEFRAIDFSVIEFMLDVIWLTEEPSCAFDHFGNVPEKLGFEPMNGQFPLSSLGNPFGQRRLFHGAYRL